LHPRRKRCPIHAISILSLLLVVLTPPILGCLLLLLVVSVVLKPIGWCGCVRPPLAIVCRGLLRRLLLLLSLAPQRPILVILLLTIQVDLFRRGHIVPVLVCPPSVSLLSPVLLLSLLRPVGGCLRPARSSLEV
jgi:hypothetical protein